MPDHDAAVERRDEGWRVGGWRREGGQARPLLTPPIAFTVVVASNPAMRLPNLERDLSHDNISDRFLLGYLIPQPEIASKTISSYIIPAGLKQTLLAPTGLFRLDASKSQQQHEHNTI